MWLYFFLLLVVTAAPLLALLHLQRAHRPTSAQALYISSISALVVSESLLVLV